MDFLKRFFSRDVTGADGAGKGNVEHDTRLAVCALCVEIARIDGTFSPQELEKVIAVLKEKYDLSAENIDALISEADKELAHSVDLWQFARLINENYTIYEKIDIIEMFWRIVYVDGKMDEHEHYLMNKLSNLLRLSHNQLIDAKLKILRQKK